MTCTSRAYRVLTLGCAVLSVSSMTDAQPIDCTDDSQCVTGFYCEKSAHFCRECLRCEDLKREPPAPPDGCVKSVLQCGDCMKGLIEDLRLDRECVRLSDRPDSSGPMPWYAWVFIGLPLLGFVAIVVYVLWRKDAWFSYIFRVRTSACASVHQNGAVSGPNEPPPPYNPYYEPVRPKSPSETEQTHGEDPEAPFIKRAGAGESGPTSGPRESAGRQEALPYSYPNWVREPANGLGINNAEESGPASPFPPSDEDTMPSFWTPSETTNNQNGNDISDNAAEGVTASAVASDVTPADPLGAVARRAPPAAGPPAKAARLREDTNNNRGRESHVNGPEPEHGPSPPHAHSFVINVVTNINNMEQRNSVNMPKL